MRMSCNGCRVLRKGCSEKCSIKSCLQWIKSPDAQANATVFLAKFYGRAGLLNLINAGPSHLRPAIFRSLMYEACGRIVSPINGSTGLLLAGKWQLCQEAAEAVLSGSPIKQESETAATSLCPDPLKVCDIRHVSKDENEAALVAAGRDLQRTKTRRNFKKASVKPKSRVESSEVDNGARVIRSWGWSQKDDDVVGSPRPDSALSQHVEVEPRSLGGESVGDADSGSERTVEAAHEKLEERADYSDGELELELTLGFEPVLKRQRAEPVNADFGVRRSDGDLCTKSKLK